MGRPVKFAILCLFLLALLVAPAFAANVQPLRVDPSRFIFEGKPGDELTGSITVINKGSEPAVTKAVLSDWTLNPDNKVVVKDAGTLASTLNGSIKFNPRSFTVKPGARQVVRFTVKIPRDAKPGEWRGMIAFEQVVPPSADATGATIRAQITSTIYVAVLPVERKCEIVWGQVVRDQASGTTRINLDVKGTGLAHFRGTGKFKILKENEKEPVAQGDLGPVVILPDVTTRFVGSWSGALPPGKYGAAIIFEPEQPKVQPVYQTFEFALK